MARAYHAHDAQLYAGIVAPEFTLVFRNGQVYSRDHELDALQKPGTEPPDVVYGVDSQFVRVYADAAVSVGRFFLMRRDTLLTESRFTNTDLRRDGRWQAVASHMTSIRRPSP